MAPICGSPAASRTYPVIVPGRSAAHAGSDIPSTIAQILKDIPSWRSFTLPHPWGERRDLFDRKYRRRIDSLLRNSVVYLDFDLVNAGLQVRRPDRFLQRNLFAQIAHGIGRFGLLHYRLVR